MKWGYSIVGFILFSAIFSAVPRAALAAVDYYCTCRSDAGGDCKETKISSSANPKPTQSDCDTFCTQTPGKKRILFTTDGGGLYSVGVTETSPMCYNHCWCQQSDGTCKDYTRKDDGSIFKAGDECISFCKSKQLEAKHWDDYTVLFNAGQVVDETKSADCQLKPPSAFVAPPAPTAADSASKADPAAPADKLIELKAQAAKSLNRVSFGSTEEIIGQVIKFQTAFMGTIAFVLYLYAGVLWMSAMGNSEQIEKAKNIFVWTTMGVGAILASVVVVRFLFHDILQLI